MSLKRNQSRNVMNFAAGPSALPYECLERAKEEFLNYSGTGSSVMELSHRSSVFSKILHKAEQDLRALINIPDNYKVLFCQGGGNGQFSSVPLNLINLKPKRTADYIVTGYWSERAAIEAQKYGNVNFVVPKTKSYTTVPEPSTWKLDPEASYVFYCDNETIHGVEYDFIPDTGDVPLIADCSSNFISRPIDIKKFGLIFAGAQKNCGPAGVTIVIVRDDLLGHQLDICPTIMDYSILVGNNSLYQTPPTFGIYMCGLVFDWTRNVGGLEHVEKINESKAMRVYEAIDKSNDFYFSPVEPRYRSRMNIPYRIRNKTGAFDEKLEKKFIEDAEKLYNMKELKGHRAVGGIRASVFNAISLEEVDHLVSFMNEFAEKHRDD